MPEPWSRRRFLAGSVRAAALGSLSACLPLPAWASARGLLEAQPEAQDAWDLDIGETPVFIADRRATALGINGSVPGPLVRLREGQDVVINVRNTLAESTSIHWHGLLVPTGMDGVPGLSFDGIAPGDTWRYAFPVRQSGTYWYHSHSGLQEQSGIYGPLVIDPAGPDPVAYDREFVVLLSDWTFEDPKAVLRNLKAEDDYYSPDRRTGHSLFDGWSRMRMSQSDLADVTGLTYTYLLNGHDSLSNWTGQFEAGERVRLRFINGSAMSFFNVRIPGVAMSVVQADGQNITPVVVEEFQLGTAETLDVVVSPPAGSHTIMCESADRSGFVHGTLTTRPGLAAAVPPLRKRPLLGMQDMGMSHAGMPHDTGDAMQDHDMPHHAAGHSGHSGRPRTGTDGSESMVVHEHPRGPGVANLAEHAVSRLAEPGIGLEDTGHRVLTYADLRSLAANHDQRPPGRTLELHLTGNMHRYMWSFDGKKYSEVTAPIQFEYGERLRMVLVNDTMMAHPIHLHGMFVELVNGHGNHNPRKHTVVVKPAERLAVDITADEPGLWAFHCHLLYHMKAGMMRAVRVSERPA